MACLNVIYGAGSAGSWRHEIDGPQVLGVLEELGVETIDTAYTYKDSEKLVGERGAPARFNIHTKNPGGFAQAPATKENVLKFAETSFGLMRTPRIDTYYLHAPDRTTQLEQTLDGINELYKQGRFEHFGLSNFLPSEVEEVIRISKEKGFVLPTIYQGNYSAIARKQEVELLPLLRKHGIAFNAYSPLAGGFLTKTAADFKTYVGRFNPANPIGNRYMTLYKKPAFLAALGDWDRISTESGISKAELAYRWVAYHSSLKPENGDGIIIGARSLDQLRQNLSGLKRGPLPAGVAQQIDQIWDKVKGEAGLDNFNLNNA